MKEAVAGLLRSAEAGGAAPRLEGYLPFFLVEVLGFLPPPLLPVPLSGMSLLTFLSHQPRDARKS
jgi:hypothetical protein